MSNMNDYFEDVGDFHRKFGLKKAGLALKLRPHLLPQDDFYFRLAFILEETQELIVAHRNSDLAGCADALIDIVYVALGAAQEMELPWQALWAEVQRANMTKERATGDDDPRSKRGYGKDIIKPEGWRPPDLAGVLRQFMS